MLYRARSAFKITRSVATTKKTKALSFSLCATLERKQPLIRSTWPRGSRPRDAGQPIPFARTAPDTLRERLARSSGPLPARAGAGLPAPARAAHGMSGVAQVRSITGTWLRAPNAHTPAPRQAFARSEAAPTSCLSSVGSRPRSASPSIGCPATTSQPTRHTFRK